MNSRTVMCAVLVALSTFTPSVRGSNRDTIYETLVASEQTAVLAIAAKEAGAAALLKGKDEYTVFAPTDDAFLKLNDDTIGAIVNNKEVIQKLLRAHLVKGTHTAAALKKKAAAGESLTTVSGEQLKIEDRKDGLFVGGVKIETADIECKNGVIHLLDTLRVVPKE